jgi:hypothetical protein
VKEKRAQKEMNTFNNLRFKFLGFHCGVWSDSCLLCCNTLYSLVDGYWRFRGTCCLHLQGHSCDRRHIEVLKGIVFYTIVPFGPDQAPFPYPLLWVRVTTFFHLLI